MNLFDDTDLFTSAEKKKVVFDLPDTELILFQGFFTKQESDFYYQALLENTPWRETQLTVYDKKHTVPRMIAWFENSENPGAGANNPPYPPEILAVKHKVEQEINIDFNSVLLNLYRDGKDGVGWHSDKTKNFGKNAIIASVTFGETRPFRLRHKMRKEIPQVEILLQHGSFLLMAGTTQTFWEHQIPKTAKSVLPRINLTFRQIDRNL